MSPFVAELIGTSLLLLLVDGVVANTVLRYVKGTGGTRALMSKGSRSEMAMLYLVRPVPVT
ncbi:MAG: hypothetical protein WBA12_04335 [Catalinimonas sp.]